MKTHTATTLSLFQLTEAVENAVFRAGALAR